MTRLVAIVVILAVQVFVETPAALPSPPGVETLMADVGSHTGPVRVRGIVGKTVAEKQIFSLVDLSDREELIRTGKTQCVTLPVRWTKEMPGHAVVLVAGQVREIGGRLVFVADSVTADGADGERH